MRLINVKTFKLEEFFDGKAPPYAILSHTWGNDNEEVSFQDIEKWKIEKPIIWPIKFEGCCKQAKMDGLQYAWIDTCCIDKANSVELYEAINSMFRWYRDATICYTYLSDVPSNDNPTNPGSKFFSSRWFKRGWTLQELLAPKKLIFYNSEWCFLGTKRDMSVTIEKITGIPRPFLLGIVGLHEASVAQRMSWAAKRVTKRSEDIAYCLLGIFGVMMPMIYGEGSEAFSRLQQEIMNKVKDDSILAWGLTLTNSTPSNSTEAISGGVLAAAPSDFVNCRHIVSRKQYTTSMDQFHILGGTLRIQLPLFASSAGETFGLLQCGPEHNTEQVVGIPLNVVISSGLSDEYIRPRGSYSVLLPNATSEGLTKFLHIQKDRQSKVHTAANRRDWFYVEESAETELELIEVEPRTRWHEEYAMIETTAESDGNIIQQTSTRFRHKKEGSHDFVVVLEFGGQRLQTQTRCHVMICSRNTGLENLSRKFIYMRPEAFGKQSASNGILNLNVTITQEPIAGQSMFVVRLAAAPSSAEVTVDATSELRLLDLKLELVSGLREEDILRLEAKGLGRQIDEKMANLEPMKMQLEMVEEKLRKLGEEKRLLVDGLKAGSQEINQLSIGGARIRQQQDKLSEQRSQTQQRLDNILKGDFDAKEPRDHGYETIVKLLFTTGVNANSAISSEQPLLWAAANGYEAVVKLLLENGADMAVATADRWTPIFLASTNGHIEVVKLLLEKGVDVNISNAEGWTPLNLASIKGYVNIVKPLLENGADVNIANAEGWTPLNLASSKGYVNIIKLLLEKGAAMNIANAAGWTPLNLASSKGYVDIVKLLLEKGADMTIKSRKGWTPLNSASSEGYVDIVKLLLEKGAAVNIANAAGWTPLNLASSKGYVDIVKLLLEKGADVNIANAKGLTPWNSALNYGHPHVAELLHEKKGH